MLLISSCDKVKDFLCKCDYHSARKGQESVRSLRRVVRFKRKTNLHYAEAEQDKTYRTDKPEIKSDRLLITLSGLPTAALSPSAKAVTVIHRTIAKAITTEQ